MRKLNFPKKVVGMQVNVPTPLSFFGDIHRESFRGRIVEIKGEFAVVRDQEGDCFDIEMARLFYMPVISVGGEVGYCTGIQGAQCQMEGCNGVRISTLWPDGRRTFPCSKGMLQIGGYASSHDGAFYILSADGKAHPSAYEEVKN